MGTQYSQLTIEERCELARLHTAGHSYRQIAAALDRAPSTIMREVKRNGSRTQGYQAGYADEQAWARRWVGGKLERDSLTGTGARRWFLETTRQPRVTRHACKQGQRLELL